MTYSSDRVLNHVESQAYVALDAYFSDKAPTSVQTGGGEQSILEQSSRIQNQFAEIMAGGGCEMEIVKNPNDNFLPTLKLPEGGNHVIEATLPDFHVTELVHSPYPF